MTVNEMKPEDLQPGKITLTREPLYELVWTEPIQRLAVRFGLSDVGLAKNCRGMYIPLPPRGYWARLNAGQKPPRPRAHPRPSPCRSWRRKRLKPASRTGPRGRNKAASPAGGSGKASPLVLATEAALTKQAKKNPDGMLYAWGEGVLDVRGIGLNGIDRAMRILDVIVKAVVVRRHEIVFKKGKPCVKVWKHEIGFYLSDLHETLPHMGTAEEKVRQKKEPWFAPSKYDSRSSGNLLFQIDDHYAGVPRKSWRDGKRHRIDNVLDDIVDGIEAAARCMQERDEHRERERLEWEAQQRRRHIIEQRQREESARLDAVVKAAKAWDLGKKQNAYADAVEQNANKRGEADDPEVQCWLAWARTRAAKLDPLRKELPRRKVEWDEPPDFNC